MKRIDFDHAGTTPLDPRPAVFFGILPAGLCVPAAHDALELARSIEPERS